MPVFTCTECNHHQDVPENFEETKAICFGCGGIATAGQGKLEPLAIEPVKDIYSAMRPTAIRSSTAVVKPDEVENLTAKPDKVAAKNVSAFGCAAFACVFVATLLSALKSSPRSSSSRSSRSALDSYSKAEIKEATDYARKRQQLRKIMQAYDR